MQIIRRLESLRHREHEATVELIVALCACQRTRAYADAGYGSIWQLLVRRLKYSPAAASRRNAAMRCALRFPRVLDMLRAHRTTLSALHKVEKTLLAADDPSSLLERLDGATQDDVERIVASTRPVACVTERVRNVVVRNAKPSADRSAAELFVGPESIPGTAPRIARTRSAAELPRTSARADRNSESPATEERVQLTFSLSRSDFAKLRRLKAKLSHRLPAGMTLEQIFVSLMDERLAEPKPRVRAAAQPEPTTSRHIPAATRRAVFARDGHRCTFVAPDGTRCGSDHALEVDHVLPFASGGTHELSNLRALCRTHNQRRAEIEFGRLPLRNAP